MSIENPAQWKERDNWKFIKFLKDFPKISVCGVKENKKDREELEGEKELANKMGMQPILEIGMDQNEARWFNEDHGAIYGRKITENKFELLLPPNAWRPYLFTITGGGVGLSAKWELAQALGEDIED